MRFRAQFEYHTPFSGEREVSLPIGNIHLSRKRGVSPADIHVLSNCPRNLISTSSVKVAHYNVCRTFATEITKAVLDRSPHYTYIDAHEVSSILTFRLQCCSVLQGTSVQS